MASFTYEPPTRFAYKPLSRVVKQAVKALIKGISTESERRSAANG